LKGIILAGGKGTRLYPITLTACKQLLPIYDKPMIYYPLSTLMLAGIRDILIISNPEDLPILKKILGNGSSLGISLTYREQARPRGIPEAFIIGEDFIADEPVCLILGDNIFFGMGLPELLTRAADNLTGATVFSYYVNDPERYGVLEYDKKYKIKSIKEKPDKPLSNYAITGLYFFDNNVISIAKILKPSRRHETEITDVLKYYLKNKSLKATVMGRGFAWLDTGTHDAMIEASQYVRTIEHRQGLKIACIEEVAYRMGYIDKNDLIKLASKIKNSSYGKYLLRIIEQDNLIRGK
jgi:glucose-1-phosphate thymidylyltransferase